MNAAMNRHYAIPPNLSHVWYLSRWLVNLIVCKLESGVRSLLSVYLHRPFPPSLIIPLILTPHKTMIHQYTISSSLYIPEMLMMKGIFICICKLLQGRPNNSEARLSAPIYGRFADFFFCCHSICSLSHRPTFGSICTVSGFYANLVFSCRSENNAPGDAIPLQNFQ